MFLLFPLGQQPLKKKKQQRKTTMTTAITKTLQVVSSNRCLSNRIACSQRHYIPNSYPPMLASPQTPLPFGKPCFPISNSFRKFIPSSPSLWFSSAAISLPALLDSSPSNSAFPRTLCSYPVLVIDSHTIFRNWVVSG